MIFLTVGTQLPFERLVDAVDLWANKNSSVEVFGQVGPVLNMPKHIQAEKFISPAKVDDLVSRATLIVSHAGMGSILTALRHKKPILIIPRQCSLGEHRNDHQIATAKWLGSRPGVFVAMDVDELVKKLDGRHLMRCEGQISPYAPETFTSKLGDWINQV